MFKQIFTGLLLFLVTTAQAQDRFPAHQIGLNGFRNPSIGLEYQHRRVSMHAGYYPTNFESGVTTEFLKAGVSYWFLPWGKQPVPSAFYGGLSYLRGQTRDYRDLNALAVEAGLRWVVWKGLNLRLGVIVLGAEGKSLQVNPTPGIGYSFTL
ncbi:hypothetical protein CLV84_0723 [Neolewinella xylanilytica]|uniref:DUF3575 domain-containing protein n=1 Tax=Neolewinella xylanilytica TaxID=1514080 RepID=A0A2S6I8G5_9BACT|nr:hypothetical protein [Neolewinella xylanilytica]PPK87772.1 hypothetical protein CLV84_0723 [Neolewinella xylanilytica]